MNIPTIDPIPAISGGRPETRVPKTTSSRPVSRPRTTAQAPWTRVLTVSPRCRAIRSRSPPKPSGNAATTRSGATGARPGSAGATSEGPGSPSSASRQARSHPASSWAASQLK